MRAYLTLISLMTGLSAYGQNNIFPTSGNVGIGTNTPVSPLNIATAVNTSSSTVKIGRSGDPGNTNVPVGSSTGGYNIDFTTWRDFNPDYIGARIRAERINTWLENNALIQSMDLVFSTGGPVEYNPLSEQLRITYNGNIGIGTKSPEHRLDIVGTARAHSILVNTQKTADFVFEPDYELPTLDSIQTFVQQNKHLPGIPSAKQMEKDGINVGDLQIDLLQKIEELTLHVISLQKQIDDLKTKK